MGGSEVADVGGLKNQEGTEFALFQSLASPGDAIVPQAIEVDTLLPIDADDAGCSDGRLGEFTSGHECHGAEFSQSFVALSPEGMWVFFPVRLHRKSTRMQSIVMRRTFRGEPGEEVAGSACRFRFRSQTSIVLDLITPVPIALPR